MGTLFCPSVLSFPNEWWESFCKNSPTVNLSATRFVCDETDTKNHNHKFLLITITVVSITSATVLCNWDGMASMSTNSFCQSSLIFHKTALVNCQLEWIVYLNLFFSINQIDILFIFNLVLNSETLANTERLYSSNLRRLWNGLTWRPVQNTKHGIPQDLRLD